MLEGDWQTLTEPGEKEMCGQSCDQELFSVGLRGWGLKEPQERLGEHWRRGEGRAGSVLWGMLPRNNTNPRCVFGSLFVKCSR